MDIKTTAIILCAGVGSRMGVSDNVNKCAIPLRETSAIKHVAAILAESGVDRIIVVTGYASDSIVDSLADFRYKEKITFIKNNYYAWHGCNYSLACATSSDYVTNTERVVIAEGDSILHKASIKKLVSSDADAASLIRDVSYADYARSVLAIGLKGKIFRYAYNMDHTSLPPILAEGERVIGESMQLWSFSGSPWRQLKELLRGYRERADQSSTAFTHSGVYSINQLSVEIKPIYSDNPDQWINLNTQQDLMKAGEVKWLIK